LIETLRGLYRNLEAKNPALEYVFLEITRKCDFACRHCGSDCSTAKKPDGLSVDGWKRVIAMLASSFDPPPFLVITGGEPLMEERLEELGRAAKEAGSPWGMVTNAWYLDAERLSSLASAGLASLTISLDGDRESHDHFRGKKGSYERACDAIRRASAIGGLLSDVVTCVHPGNMDGLDDMAETLIGLGAKRWRLFRIFPRGRAASGNLVLCAADYARLLDWIADRRPALRKRGLIADLSCDGWLPFALDRKVRATPLHCQAGLRIASILNDGSITGCPNNHPGLSQGNVSKDGFVRVWMEGFRPFRDRSWAAKSGCASCDALKRCQGGSMHSWDWPTEPGALPEKGALPGVCWKIGGRA
jgi:radical SAM protein with 4Fe4S-binding SPASM domain